MADQASELKAAYQRLDTAINEVARLETFEGVMTEWIVVVACQRYDAEGDGITQVGTLVPDGGGHVPYHRSMGLLDYVLTRMRAEVARDDD
ncbi:hypothetical protein EF913_28290 [Streptomyces sp. WAC04189]|uniref:hypothetical protein n=1 Tax=Streptomyces sp. WAC04189 TaxID=2487411 RepID=UPI000F996532|nr:hypothetical protein [Streptomyces sp. WAC04189]RSR98032.1 hypothetical protein EF913_28290 [Streptomyces sp. WAC04189]